MIEQARLLVLHAADRSTVGVPKMLAWVSDVAIRAHGAAGVTDDFGLAMTYVIARILRIVDGSDEVHRNQIGRLELTKYN